MNNNATIKPPKAKRKSKAEKKPNRALIVNTVERQCHLLFMHWRRKGRKTTRDEIATAMTRVIIEITQEFGISSVAGVGKRQVIWFYEKLRAAGRSQKTIDKYFYWFSITWELLGRHGATPPAPFGKGDWYKNAKANTQQLDI